MSTSPAPAAPELALIEGRTCAGCTLCCKVFEIVEMAAPMGEWCRECAVSVGCRIHPTRPQVCRDFFCAWQFWQAPGAHWRPADCHMVLVWQEAAGRVEVHCDPDFPDAWRGAPFHDDLRLWSAQAAHSGLQIVVAIGRNVTAILPDRDVDLGEIGPDDRIITSVVPGPDGYHLEVEKLKADDPRLQPEPEGPDP